jgi:N-acetylneuraminate synthase
MIRPPIAEFERQRRVFLVAEVAQAHDGSLGILHSFIDAAAAAGVDAVKFQVHIAEAESSADEPFRTRFSYVDATRFDYWQRMGFCPVEWQGVADHCARAGVEFLATPFSVAAVDLLERLGVVRYKIGSGDIANEILIRRIAATGREVILSTGLATVAEIGSAVERLRSGGVAVLQCTTRYPTKPEDVGLDAIVELRTRFRCPTGLSDHSGEVWAGIAAAAVGASVVEAHITFDKRMFGPDAAASLTVDQFADLARAIRSVERARGGTAGKAMSEELAGLRGMFGRSIAVCRALPEGHVVSLTDLEGKKPAGRGIDAAAVDRVLGRRLRRAMAKWEFLNEADLT